MAEVDGREDTALWWLHSPLLSMAYPLVETKLFPDLPTLRVAAYILVLFHLTSLANGVTLSLSVTLSHCECDSQ